jgi:UDP-N-acetylmuramoylalanine--D-glutamate ligase
MRCMRISELAKSRIAIIGYGREGRSTAQALRRWGNPHPIVLIEDDLKDAPEDGVEAVDAADVRWDEIDIAIKSPGVPPGHKALVSARNAGITTTTATNIYIGHVREAGLPVIGVTGSKGKSTTSTLIHRVLRASGKEALLLGNIGTPCLDGLEEAVDRSAWSVLEMSSYQCSDLSLGPSVAVITALFPEHLDWHGSASDYYQAKIRIARTQLTDDALVANGADSRLVGLLPSDLPGKVFFGNVAEGIHFKDGAFFDGKRLLFADADVQIPGIHNRRNICLVLAAIKTLGVDPSLARSAIADFAGLPHRCEVVGVFHGITWVNDAISTAPEAAIAALDAFSGRVTTLISGGHDRGYDFSELAKEIVSQGIPRVVVLPESGRKLEEEFLKASKATETPTTVFPAQDLAEAVAWAEQNTPNGDTCLFSPGSPSYGRYRNFEQRGEHFRSLVRGSLRKSRPPRRRRALHFIEIDPSSTLHTDGLRPTRLSIASPAEPGNEGRHRRRNAAAGRRRSCARRRGPS